MPIPDSEKEYRRVRKSVLKETNNKCVKCGSPATEVHHVNGRVDASRKALRPLCFLCHLVAPNGSRYWDWERQGKSGVEQVKNKIMGSLMLSEKDIPHAETAFDMVIEFYIENSNTKSSKRTIRYIKSKGMPAGPAPYGWTAQPRTPEEKALHIRKPLLRNEEEQKVIQIAADLREKRFSYEKIAKSLNESGYRTRAGGEWAYQYVIGILRGAKTQ